MKILKLQEKSVHSVLVSPMFRLFAFITKMKENITGLKYNMLTAIKFIEIKKSGSIWLFECECGNKVNRQLSAVKHDRVQHCGCKNKPSGGGGRLTQEDYILGVKEKHNNFYNYDKVVYTKATDIIEIGCPIHGYFPQVAAVHSRGSGCSKCGDKRQADKRTLTLAEFTAKGSKKHDNFFSYKNAVYLDTQTNLFITCPIHGDFPQTPSNHLQSQKGKSCPKCALENKGYKKEDYVNKANGRDAIMYLIRCWNDVEEFYKIGRTLLGVKTRFSGTLLPYRYDIIYEYTSNAGTIWDMEVTHHKKYRDFKYKPKLSFSGQTECFNISLPIEEIINNLGKI